MSELRPLPEVPFWGLHSCNDTELFVGESWHHLLCRSFLLAGGGNCDSIAPPFPSALTAVTDSPNEKMSVWQRHFAHLACTFVQKPATNWTVFLIFKNTFPLIMQAKVDFIFPYLYFKVAKQSSKSFLEAFQWRFDFLCN